MSGLGQPDCQLVCWAALPERLGHLRAARLLQCLQAAAEGAGCWPQPLTAGLKRTELVGALTVRAQMQQRLMLAEQALAVQQLQACWLLEALQEAGALAQPPPPPRCLQTPRTQRTAHRC